jgi:hypothetical protein
MSNIPSPEQASAALDPQTFGIDPDRFRLMLAHSNRFRRVANRYPQQVTYAYGGDLARAATDSDEQVATTVAAWEQAQGLTPRDWRAIGRAEGR